MALCKQCGVPLHNDEIAIYKKLVNRAAETYLCKQCLSQYFHCDIAKINEKIRQFRESGCFLFPPIDIVS
jgi:uncharacterized protein YlaI